MKKKVASLLLSSMLVVSLAACSFSSQSSTSNEQASQTAETTTSAAEESEADDTAEKSGSEADAAEKSESAADAAEKTGSVADTTEKSGSESDAAEVSGTETKASDSNTADTTITPAPIEGSESTETKEQDPELTEGQGAISDADLANVEVIFDHSGDDENEMGTFTAVLNGEEIWSRKTGAYPYSQLDRISDLGRYSNEYYYIEDGSVVCLDLKTGNELWRNNEFKGSPAEQAHARDENGNLLLSGYLGPDLFVCGADGTTITRIPTFDDNYYWPYALTYSEKEKTLKITYEMVPDDASDTLCISVPDYTLVDASTAESLSDDTIYYPDVEEYLSLRSEPNTDASVKRKLYPGTAMRVLETKKGWAKVIVNDTGEIGYVNAEYISTVLTTGTAITDGDPYENYDISDPNIYYPDVEEYLSLRSGPSSESSLIRKIYPGTAMRIISSEDGWAEVVVSDTSETGYVNMDYISTVLTTGTAITDGDPYGNYDISDPNTYYPDVEEYLSLRSEPSSEASVIRKIYPGTAMKIISSEDGWAEVVVSDTGETGFVNMAYITTSE